MNDSFKHIIDIENTYSESYGSDDSDSDSDGTGKKKCDDEFTTENMSDDSDNIYTEETTQDDKIDIGIKHKFNSEWDLWYHHSQNNWRIDGYKKIFTIKNIKDYWDLHNNINKIGGINNQHFFLMRNGIEPIWEDEKNKFGGCWSIKLLSDKSYDLWERLSLYMVGESLIKDSLSINGLSICFKSSMSSVIKIWNSDNNNNSLNQLPNDILKEYGLNILYKPHTPEY
jgi:hypothetical protein